MAATRYSNKVPAPPVDAGDTGFFFVIYSCSPVGGSGGLGPQGLVRVSLDMAAALAGGQHRSLEESTEEEDALRDQ
jgi:hypothetical protein